MHIENRAIRLMIIFILSITIVVATLISFNGYLDKKIEETYKTSIEHMYGNQNDFILRKSVKEDNLILLGSSELSSSVEFNPINMFPNTEYEKNITVDGRAYTQSLLHSMNVASILSENDSENTDISIIVSLQWFYGGDVYPNGFGGNFSELQFWNTMYNDKISEANKKYICSRTRELLAYNKGYDDIKTYAFLYGNRDNIFAKLGLTSLVPYYKGKYEMLKLQDKYRTYTTLKELPEGDFELPKEIDWNSEYEKAEKIGKEACTNNEFFVNDEYYDTYLKENIEANYNSSSSEKLQSKEMEDFEIFLSICNDLQINPYIIVMSTNGYYYDYIGISQDTRSTLYKHVRELTEEYGYECLTMEDKEYEPYFMVDVMHLGWKGWLYVNEQITKHFS